MKYTKKTSQKNNTDNSNKLYLFSELPKSNIREENIYSKYNNYSKKDYFLNKNNINYAYSNTDTNLTDEYINSNLLKEISELKIKINKYKNELVRAKRENNIQKIYINLLEQKYISQLISNKENINYGNLKFNINSKANKKSYQNNINMYGNKDNLDNKYNINSIYEGVTNNYRKRQNKKLYNNKYDFSYRNFKKYFKTN